MDERQKYLADLENRTTIAWRFHNQYPEINIDVILKGIKEETDIVQGILKKIAEAIPEPEPEPEPTAEELAEIAKQEEIAELNAKLAKLKE